MSNLGDRVGVYLADSPNLDAFSRLRVSNNNILYTGTFDYDKRPQLWAEKVAGGASPATHDADSRTIALTLGTASGESIIRQTKEYFRYATGNSHLIFATFHLGPKKTNVRKRVGYFDGEDGIFLEQTGTELALVIRTSTSGSPVDTNRVLQADWNLDTLDGSGDANNPSGATLDEDSTQILLIDFQWLGVGRVRIAFDIDGVIVPVHAFNNANVGQTTTYMKTPNLPVRYEIENTGVAASGTTLRQICASVIREGGQQVTAEERTVDTGLTRLTATDEITTLIGIRLKSTHVRAILQFLSAAVLNFDANDPIRFAVYRNPSVDTSGAVWTSVSPDSAAEFSVSNININAGPGDLILAGYVGAVQGSRGVADNNRSRGARALADIDAVPDEIWLTAQCGAVGATAPCLGNMAFEELR